MRRGYSECSGIICLGEHVELTVREGVIEQSDIDECMEYIKLVNYYNKTLPDNHRFKVRWMFFERINPSHAVGIEYIYHYELSPLFTEDRIREMFHDQCEVWSGIINVVQVKITGVNMHSDYFFENDPGNNTKEGFK